VDIEWFVLKVPADFDFVIKKQEQAKEQYQEQKMERTLVFLNDDHNGKEKTNSKKFSSDNETNLSQLNWNFLPPPSSPNESDIVFNFTELVPAKASIDGINSNIQLHPYHSSPLHRQNNNNQSTHSTTMNVTSKSSDKLLLDFDDNSIVSTTTVTIPVTPIISESKLATSEKTTTLKLNVPTNSKPSTSISPQKTVHYSEGPIDNDFLTLRKENPLLTPQTSPPSSTLTFP
jgi:hypothetical protein